MRDIFVDPKVLLLAIGGEHPRKAGNRDPVLAAARGGLRLHLSVKVAKSSSFTAPDEAVPSLPHVSSIDSMRRLCVMTSLALCCELHATLPPAAICAVATWSTQ